MPEAGAPPHARTARRCLAIVLPHLATDRLRRTPPGTRQGAFSAWPDDKPLVTVAKIKNAITIASADRAARALGLIPGLALADARARVPDLAVAEADDAADAALLEKIADWCDRYTPCVGHPGHDGLILDITGCTHLFASSGCPDGEREMLKDIYVRLRRRGFDVAVAIAGNADAARALARTAKPGIVPDGRDAAAVSPLPIGVLDIDDAAKIALRRAGLKTIGDVAARPRAPLAARFGAALLYRLDRLLGTVDTQVSPRRIVPIARADATYYDPLVRSEDVLAALKLLAAELAQTLDGRGEGGRRFEASIFRVDGAVRRISVTTARATRDAGLVTRLFAERMETLSDPLDAGFGFEHVRLSALVAEPLAPSQDALAAGDSNTALLSEALVAFIEQQSIRLGPERVQRFTAVDTHIPERTERSVPAMSLPHPPAWPRTPEADEPPARPLSLFDPPQPVETLAAVPDGPPRQFRWRRVLHTIVRAEGPERIAPEWWCRTGSTLTRDYYRVEDREGRRFWLFREGLYGREAEQPRWYVHGLFA